jgi:hypothetical protein
LQISGFFGRLNRGDPFYVEAAAGQFARMTWMALGGDRLCAPQKAARAKSIRRTESRFNAGVLDSTNP